MAKGGAACTKEQGRAAQLEAAGFGRAASKRRKTASVSYVGGHL
jgi:hypothetical protein